MKIAADQKRLGSQSKNPQAPGGVFPSSPKRLRPISTDPKEILSRLVLADGSVKEVGDICEENPETAEWLIRKIAQVDELRVRDGKESGRFEVYEAAARQALARAHAIAFLAKISRGEA